MISVDVLSPFRLETLDLRNRVAVAPMSRMQACDDGTASAEMAAYYARYARYGAGLIFAEAAYIDEIASRAYFRQPGLATERQGASWMAVTRAVHGAGGRIFAQLQHAGRLAEPGLNRLHLAASEGAAAGTTWQTGVPNAPARAATLSEIEAIVEAFARAARLAVEAGFDGVELHGARGYLLDDFLSAGSNRRDDAFGGTPERRLTLALAVVRGVRRAIGTVPLSFNFSLYKMDDARYTPPGGSTEVITISRALREAGVDIIHVTNRRALRPEAWGEPLARTVRDASPAGHTIANGGLVTLQDCAAALVATGAALVSLARPFLANPDWVERVRAGGQLRQYVTGQERQPLLQMEVEEEHAAGT